MGITYIEYVGIVDNVDLNQVTLSIGLEHGECAHVALNSGFEAIVTQDLVGFVD
jgi:hypothetical protein